MTDRQRDRQEVEKTGEQIDRKEGILTYRQTCRKTDRQSRRQTVTAEDRLTAYRRRRQTDREEDRQTDTPRGRQMNDSLCVLSNCLASVFQLPPRAALNAKITCRQSEDRCRGAGGGQHKAGRLVQVYEGVASNLAIQIAAQQTRHNHIVCFVLLLLLSLSLFAA